MSRPRRKKAPKRNRVFDAVLRDANLPLPDVEYRFHATRRWRFDYAWPDARVALEVEGGAFSRGRHTRGAGFVADIEKYNAAVVDGWRLVRTTPDKLVTRDTIEMLSALLQPDSERHDH